MNRHSCVPVKLDKIVGRSDLSSLGLVTYSRLKECSVSLCHQGPGYRAIFIVLTSYALQDHLPYSKMFPLIHSSEPML